MYATVSVLGMSNNSLASNQREWGTSQGLTKSQRTTLDYYEPSKQLSRMHGQGVKGVNFTLVLLHIGH